MCKTFLGGMITETIPVLEYSRIQWVVVVVFSEFLFFFFLNALWGEMKRSTLDITGQEHQRLQCFLIRRRAELPDYGLFQWAF